MYPFDPLDFYFFIGHVEYEDETFTKYTLGHPDNESAILKFRFCGLTHLRTGQRSIFGLITFHE